MVIHGLDSRITDLARGIIVLRTRRELSADDQRGLIAALADADMTTPPEGELPSFDGGVRRLIAVPWAPPSRDAVETQKSALEAIGVRFEVDIAWCFKIETAIDGVAWTELMHEVAPDAGTSVPMEPAVVYQADVKFVDVDDDDDDDDDDTGDGGDDDDDDGTAVESHWRNGPPPTETAVPFPIERYPEIVDEFDWTDFGLAIKLGGVEQPGEDSVVNAMFALWLSAYQDERVDGFEPFGHADVIHDRRHRSVMLWIDRLTVPATPSDQVNFLLWIAARLHEIVPLAWARFDQADGAEHRRGADDEPFVLAGNPFAERFRRDGEAPAMAWAVAQSLWSRRELAAMLVELAIEHDPDDAVQAAIAERLLLRAGDLDPSCEAPGYLSTVMVRQDRFDDALTRVSSSHDARLRCHLFGEAVEHAPDRARDALALLVDDVIAELPDDELAELATRVAEHAPGLLADYLRRLPSRASLVPHLYNASFPVERSRGLAILSRVVELPEPDDSDEAARAAFVMAWNNACIHAHAIGDFERACELADGAQRFAAENPYIFHSAACAYAAAGRLDQALVQVKQAIDHGYDHIEKMEVDDDLGPLLAAPEFRALFSEWRSQRADLN